jgi:hypothetical protein
MISRGIIDWQVCMFTSRGRMGHNHFSLRQSNVVHFAAGWTRSSCIRELRRKREKEIEREKTYHYGREKREKIQTSNIEIPSRPM